MKNKTRFSPYILIIFSFISIILIGSAILSLPIVTLSGESTPFLDALFTSTSAVCVTGLAVNNINTTYNALGKGVILFLVQLGALGILTFSSMLVLLISKKIGYYTKKIISEDINYDNIFNIAWYLKRVIIVVFCIEFVGFLLLFSQFVKKLPIKKAIFYSIFHSVTAFCNAGFSLFDDSLVNYTSDIKVNFILIILIILGGLGFSVIIDIIRSVNKNKRITINSKFSISTSIILIVIGTIMFFLSEYNNVSSIGNMSIYEKGLASLFQSVSSRTAGFNTVNISNIRPLTILVFSILMFIGASPGSTGGGIKTTTFAVIILGIWTSLKNRENIEYKKRRIKWSLFNKAIIITSLSIFYILIAVMVLIHFDPDKDFLKILFEVTSAFGTTGLSLGITPDLSAISKCMLIITMFVGRIGTLTIALSVSKEKKQTGKYKYPSESILIG